MQAEPIHKPISQIPVQRTGIGILGAGSWATALVHLLTRNRCELDWWVRTAETRSHLREYGKNLHYLPNVELPTECLRLSESVREVVARNHRLLVCIPSAWLDEALQSLTAADWQGKQVISAVKGFEVHSGCTISEYFQQRFEVCPEDYALISGPSHAEEVAADAQTYLAVASKSTGFAQEVVQLLTSPNLVARPMSDVKGIELAAILKNVYTLAAGMAVGAGRGDNFLAVLVAAALREMAGILAVVVGDEQARNICQVPYLGDLLVSAYSPHSRNRRLGLLLGQGWSTPSALDDMHMVAEGYYAVRILVERWPEVSMPLARGVYQVLYEARLADTVLTELAPILY